MPPDVAHSPTSPLYPEFPRIEFEHRWTRARELMAQRSIDILFLTSRENVEYFSGFRTVHWLVKSFAPGVVLFPADHDPVLLIAGFLRGTAEKTSWIQRIQVNPDAHSNNAAFPALMVDTLRQLGMAEGTIGIEFGSEMVLGVPLHHFEEVRSALPRARFAGIADLIWELRTIKSPLELANIGEASRIVCEAFAAVRDGVRSGATEVDIADQLKGALVRGGTDPTLFVNIRAGRERYNMADVHPQPRPVQVGDVLVLDAGVLYHGYWSDIARVMHIGTASTEHEEVYRVCLQAHHAALEQVRAGVAAHAVYAAARRILDERNFGRWQDMIGHGIGLDLHEPPFLTPRSGETLKAGMVLCIEPWINLPDLGVFAVEDMVEVIEDGYRLLTPLPADELWQTPD